MPTTPIHAEHCNHMELFAILCSLHQLQHEANYHHQLVYMKDAQDSNLHAMLTSTKSGLVQISIYADTKSASNQESVYQLKTSTYAGIKSQIAFLMGWDLGHSLEGLLQRAESKCYMQRKARKRWGSTHREHPIGYELPDIISSIPSLGRRTCYTTTGPALHQG